jgi:hypothetical protein
MPPAQEMQHITKWSKLVHEGWEAFTRELLLDQSKANPKPLVFAILTNADTCIQMAHGFGLLELEANEHPCNGLLGVLWVTDW